MEIEYEKQRQELTFKPTFMTKNYRKVTAKVSEAPPGPKKTKLNQNYTSSKQNPKKSSKPMVTTTNKEQLMLNLLD